LSYIAINKIPTHYKNLKNLKTFHFEGKYIEEFPEWIFELKNLEHVVLNKKFKITNIINDFKKYLEKCKVEFV